MKTYTLVLLSGLVLQMAGCKTAPTPVVTVEDPAAIALDRAIVLASPARVIGPESPKAVPIFGPKTSVSYLGDAGVLLKNAAAGSGTDWTYSQTGPFPHLPIYVQIDVKEVAFNDFLKSVAEQLGQRADIELGNKKITLRYRAIN